MTSTSTETSQHSFPFGHRFRWLRRIIMLVLLLAFCVGGFAPELGTVIWHLRNGSTADFAGMRLRVPFWSYAIVQPRTCTIILPAGIVRGLLGAHYHHASFRIESTTAPDALRRLLEARVARGEMRRAGNRRTALLGAMMVCSQYDTPDGRGVTIECLRGSEGPAPYYSGPAGSEQQFYNLLASATSMAAPTSADAP
jgi:hypothetical protein